MKIHPTTDRVLIKLEKPESVTKGGIIIPATAQEDTLTGVVVDFGPEVPAGTIAVGDKVLYDKFGGTPLTVDGEPHVIIRFPDVHSVISE